MKNEVKIRSAFLLVLCIFAFSLVFASSHVCIPFHDQQSYMDSGVSKTARKMRKVMQKEGWKALGGKPISETLNEHYVKLSQMGSNAVMVEGHGEARQLNVAIRIAQNNATIQYAQMMGTQIDGRTLTEISSVTTSESKSTTKFDATYVAKVQQLVKALIPSASFYLQREDGTYVVRAFYIAKGEIE